MSPALHAIIKTALVSLFMAFIILVSAASFASDGVKSVAITWKGNNSYMPHIVCSGSSVTAKAVARGLTQDGWYRIDCNDSGDLIWDTRKTPGLPYWIPMEWYPISASFPYLEWWFSYTGTAGKYYNVVSQVWETSTYPSPEPPLVFCPVRICESTDPGSPEHMQVRFDMATNEGLWALHKSMTRGIYSASSPGYGQPYGCWSNSIEATAMAVTAFLQWGVKPDGDPEVDPYVEDVRLALNYLLANLRSSAITSQTAGNPDTNGNGIGISYMSGPNGPVMATSKALMAIANAGTPTRTATVGAANIYQRTYSDIATDIMDYLVWAQGDVGTGRGGWSLWPNDPNSVMEAAPWPVLALGAAERKMGFTVPAFVRSELQYFLTIDQYLGLDTNNGCFRWDPDYYTNYGCLTASSGIVLYNFMGVPASDARVQRAVGYLYRHWNDQGAVGSYVGLLGWSEAMFMTMNALSGMQPFADKVTEYDYTANCQTQNSFNWLLNSAGQTNTGIGNYIVNIQATPEHPVSGVALGFWTDSIAGGTLLVSRSYPEITAIRMLTLLGNGMRILPDTSAPNGSIQVYGSSIESTDTPNVWLRYDAWDVQSGVKQVRLRNEGSDWSLWSDYNGNGPIHRTWTLPPGNGDKTVYVQFEDEDGHVSEVFSDTIRLEVTPLTVAINQSENQDDPAIKPTICFSVVFSQHVYGFDSSDVTLGGNAGANYVSVSGSGSVYQVSVSGMAQSGTVTASIPAGAAHNSIGINNEPSTSIDNTVNYNLLPIVGVNIKAAKDPIMALATNKFRFRLWGQVENPIIDFFELSDGGNTVSVYAPGHSFVAGELAAVTGVMDVRQNPPILTLAPYSLN